MKKVLFITALLIGLLSLNSCEDQTESYDENQIEKQNITHDEVGDEIDDNQQEGGD